MHIAVGIRNNVDFVKELLEYMPARALELQDKFGCTSLVYAARAGNTKAAKMLVRKNSNLPQQQNNTGKTPLQRSAELGHREMTEYLLSVTRDEFPSPYRGKSGILLLNSVIIAGFYDVALHLVQCYPNSATTKEQGVDTPLYTLSRMHSAFPSGTQLSFWQCLICKCVHVKLDNELPFPTRSDTENPTQSSKESMQMSNWLRFVEGIQISSGNSEAAGSSADHLGSSAVNQLLSPEDEYDGQLSSSEDEDDGGEEITRDYNQYLPLYKATLKGDWTTAKRFLDLFPEAATAPIAQLLETVMHIAVGVRNNVDFVKELLEYMPAEALESPDVNGDTSLMYAAGTGNTKAAKMLVRKNSNLPQQQCDSRKTALLHSAEYGHKETTKYLLSVTRDEDPSPFRGKSGIRLLNYVIIAGFYDVALHLVQRYPNSATTKEQGVDTPLYTLSRMCSAFPSGTQLSSWQCLIYKCVHVKLDNELPFPTRSDTENPTQSSKESMQMSNWLRFVEGTQISSVRQSLNIGIWQAIKQLVPGVKKIQDKKLMHLQTIQLVKSICAEIVGANNSKAKDLVRSPMLNAASNGIHEIVTEIVQAYPSAIWFSSKGDCNIFHLAVLNRQVKVFNLIHQMSSFKHILLANKDKSGYNVLHMVAKLAPSPQLNSVAGAALQMQRELQWFKEVEKIVQPSFIEMTDKQGRTPKMVFTEEHANLVKEGEKWMKDTATSCMVVATLIATVVFAAAFTVPGGNNVQGIPIFLQNKSFIVFAIADALSLFSSTTSVLMFLSILTSRYAEEDFLHSLPKRLIIGLTTLFFSIATMMIAFSATLSIVLDKKIAWVAIPVTLLACVPITFFVLLQFPLLVDIVLSTYGPSIFHKQNRDVFH